MARKTNAPTSRPYYKRLLARQIEVTEGQWKRFIKAAGVPWDEEHFFVSDNHPMTGISWLHCQAYCRFYGLSLPTEAQGEWAACGPAGRLYPWGNFWNPRLCCNMQNPGPAISGVPLCFTAPVGRFSEGASWCGAHDMAGNVDEWCAEWLSPTYYALSPVEDPPGPSAGTERVLEADIVGQRRMNAAPHAALVAR